MIFKEGKRRQLSKEDKSYKGHWDKAIINLCEKINKRKDCYTTSSCAGRIILLKFANIKKPGLFLFMTHNKINFDELKRKLEELRKREESLVYFKQEPCILHVACKDVDVGEKLVKKAKFAGWKRSGMMSSGKRVMCELMSTEHIEFPIIDKGKILVDDDFLKIIVREANRKLLRTRRKIKKLRNLV